MTVLAYMVREDWAQHGTTMVPSSARIRDWIGDGPVLFAVTDETKFRASERSADLEAAEYIDQPSVKNITNIRNLTRLAGRDGAADAQVVVLHPFEQRDCEALREAIGAGAFSRVFVLIWSPGDIIRTWLDAHDAIDLHTGVSVAAPTGLQVAAAELMVNEQYNGLSSGRGKDTVVQLLRASAEAGYPLDEGAWLRAFFAAGGTFRHAEPVAKFVREMQSGVKHRVNPAFRADILDVLRERFAAS